MIQVEVEVLPPVTEFIAIYYLTGSVIFLYVHYFQQIL